MPQLAGSRRNAQRVSNRNLMSNTDLEAMATYEKFKRIPKDYGRDWMTVT